MTEKRFYKTDSSIEKYRIYDDDLEDAYFISCDEHTIDTLIELLNEQDQEIKHLKSAEVLVEHYAAMVKLANSVIKDFGNEVAWSLWRHFQEAKYHEWQEYKKTKEGSETMTKKGPVSPEEIVELYNAQVDEIKQLKKKIQKADGFECTITEYPFEVNKDELHVKDNNTRIELKDGHLWISVFIPQLNESKEFNYHVTGRTY